MDGFSGGGKKRILVIPINIPKKINPVISVLTKEVNEL
jgi:hypothetical protein